MRISAWRSETGEIVTRLGMRTLCACVVGAPTARDRSACKASRARRQHELVRAEYSKEYIILPHSIDVLAVRIAYMYSALTRPCLSQQA